MTDMIDSLKIDNSTRKLTGLGRNFPIFGASSSSAINKLKINLSQKYWDIENIEHRENIELAEFAASLLHREHNEIQMYTNSFSKSIQTNLLIFSPFLVETSNQVINSGLLSLVNNFFTHIKNLYILTYPVEILQYLNDKKHLIYLLVEAHEKIKAIFTDEKIVLRISYDPEIISWKKLIIDIHTKLDVDQAFDKLKILDNSWWLDVSFYFGNDLDINISFDEI